MGGWDHVDYFQVLRSMTTVNKDKLVPICVSQNLKVFTYRFENTEAGCVGSHSSGTVWDHAFTFHSSKDALGDQICVGVQDAGANTGWLIQKGTSCNTGNYKHAFSFAAMRADQHIAPLVHACLLSTEYSSGSSWFGSSADEHVRIKRIAVGTECKKPPPDWKQELDLEFLARDVSSKSNWICGARGEIESFWGAPCGQSKVSTTDTNSETVKWSIDKELTFYVPEDASGLLLCLCHVNASNTSGNAIRLFSWFEGNCPRKETEEMCLKE